MEPKNSTSGGVVYVDHARHLTPLTLTYHATASRHLTTGRTDVVPPSTSVEVDSVYCPRCFSYCTAPPTSLGVCEKSTGGGLGGGCGSATSCKDCPICFCPVSVSIDAAPVSAEAGDDKQLLCHYLCGYCGWSSQECGVTSNASKLKKYQSSRKGDEDVANDWEKQRQEIIFEISRDLEHCLKQKVEQRNKHCDSLFSSIVEIFIKQEKEEERNRRLGIGEIARKTERADTFVGPGGWSLESLEQSLIEKQKEIDSPWIWSPGGLVALSDTTTSDKVSVEQIQQQPNPQQTAAQMVITNAASNLRSHLLPIPVPFRSRVSRRCLAELATGKTGIVIKPKLNPLEGDSSIKFGQGQWWKKDSNAVNVVPRVQLCCHGSNPTKQSFAALLKVRNATLGVIRLRLSGLSVSADSSSATIDQLELDNIIIDPIRETFVQGRHCSFDVISSLSPTEWLELEHAEDEFLDIGKGREQDPQEVLEWDANKILSSTGDDSGSFMRVLATRRDTAWVELKLTMAPDDFASGLNHGQSYLAVPIAMEIEVGNGSWEASLIKRRDIPENEVDATTLGLVVLLR
mmetsp:Transcript_11028/g.23204  ORF Transcript_11028/g.23204 Transcript_11028/m.23204 type:complete len:572 (-) Transcript_11028:204-1919(-)